jgi:uncharacterized membrane protein
MNESLILCIACGLSFFSIGVKLNRDPGPIASRLGYRTRASMRNEDTWYEANIFAGRWLMLLAVLLLVILAVAEVLTLHQRHLFLIVASAAGSSIVAIYFMTEVHMKRLFFKDGKRRPKF